MGRNNADFHGIDIESTSGNSDSHSVIATHPEHGTIGRLNWEGATSNRPGRVAELWVDPEHRRKGIATAMWGHANRMHKEGVLDISPVHSEERTDKGDAFAKSVGGLIPKRERRLNSDPGLEAEPFTPREPSRRESGSGV